MKGLKDLEEFKKHDGVKNLKNPSQRSRYSNASAASSYKRRMASLDMDEGVPVENVQLMSKGGDLRKPIDFLDEKTGKTLTLTAEHLILLEQLSRHNDLNQLTDDQLDLLQTIDFDSL